MILQRKESREAVWAGSGEQARREPALRNVLAMR